MPPVTLHHSIIPYTRCFVRDLPEVAKCSRCKKHVAYWFQKRGRYQRYWCNSCVMKTAAWKQGQISIEGDR